MHAQIILSDFAQAAGGKLNLIGAGWTMIKSPPGALPLIPQMGIGLLIDVAYNETNVKHKILLQLVNADGHPVLDPNSNEIKVGLEVEQGRPPGLAKGASQRVALAFNISLIPAEPGRYTWQALLGELAIAKSTFEVME